MRVTKFPQSCFRIEKNERAILIDIGNFATSDFTCQEIGSFEAILITHQHSDHIDPELQNWLGEKNIPIYANQDVAEAFPTLPIIVVSDNTPVEIAGLEVTPLELPHCKMPDGSTGPPNTGYLIDGTFFHPGDGVSIDNLSVDTLAAPIAGPSVSLYSAVKLSRQVKAKTVIPMHYDNPIYFNEPNVLAKRFKEARVLVLNNNESTEI